MDNSSQDQLITEIQDPTPPVVPSPQSSAMQTTPISQPPNSSSNGTIMSASAQQAGVPNAPDTTTLALRQKLLEELRLATRDISQKIVETQFPLREVIAKVQEKMSLGITLTPLQGSQQIVTSEKSTQESRPLEDQHSYKSPQMVSGSLVSQESQMPPPSSQEAVVSEGVVPTQNALSQSSPGSVSDQSLAEEVAAVPPVSEVGQQPEGIPSQTIQQAEVPIYTDALHTLSETGVNLLKGIVELDRKQPGPEPSTPLMNHGTITDQDLVEFILNENNDPKLKDFGDMKVVRKIMREKLGLPSETVSSMGFPSNPESVQASVSSGPSQAIDSASTMPKTPEIEANPSAFASKEEVVTPEQLAVEPTPSIPLSSSMPAVGSDPSPVVEQTPSQFVPVEQTESSAAPEKGSVMGFLHKLFKKSS